MLLPHGLHPDYAQERGEGTHMDRPQWLHPLIQQLYPISTYHMKEATYLGETRLDQLGPS